MPQVESRDNFIPTDHERRVLLELIQSPQESLESIAHELKITLAALTIYLATDDAASLFAQADLANARRARTAAAAHLEKCVGALALIIDDFVSDITHNLQRETPKSRREQDRQKETTRRAATVLYRIANFTPKTLTLPTLTPPAPRPPAAPPLPAKRGEVPESARAVRGLNAHIAAATPHPTPNIPALTNPTRQRGATPVTIALPVLNNHPLPPTTRTASTSPERQQAAPLAPTSEIPNPKSQVPPSDTPAAPSPRHDRSGPSAAANPHQVSNRTPVLDGSPIAQPSSARCERATVPP
ncbi:MAG TPA: hypothetical protein VF777_10370 [Phycisphaerales bacterium]